MDKQVFGYSRVSSEEQAAHGISIDAQRGILEGYAAMTSRPIRIFEDAGFSGKNTNRPALQQLLAAVSADACSTVVVWKLDRLSRNLRDTLHIIEDILQPAGVSLVSVTESIDTSTPSGRMMLNLLASFAQLEREQDSDRVVMAHKHLARDCKYLGGHVPLGYRIDADKHYQLDPETAPVVRNVFDLYLARSGYAPILHYLNSGEILPLCRRARPFTKQDLLFMLKNEIYAGVYVRRLGADPRHRITAPETIRIPGGVPAIITADEWERASVIREQNRIASASYRASNVYPLAGLVFCSVCGGLMKIRHGGKTRSGETERYYSCRSSCVPPARLEQIEEAVFSAIDYLASDEELIAEACRIANEYNASDQSENLQEAVPLRKRLQEIARQKARIVSFVKNNDSASSSMMDELIALECEEKAVSGRLEAISRPATLYDTQQTVRLLRQAADIRKLPPEERKARIQAAVSRILVSEDTYRILIMCPTSCGDEPRHYVEHTVKRKNGSEKRSRRLPVRQPFRSSSSSSSSSASSGS